MNQRTVEHAGKHILVVEDDEATAEMLIMLLTTEGYAVTRVTRPEDAGRVLAPSVVPPGAQAPAFRGPANEETPYPDLILLDLRLPGLDGAEMMRQLAR